MFLVLMTAEARLEKNCRDKQLEEKQVYKEQQSDTDLSAGRSQELVEEMSSLAFPMHSVKKYFPW